MSVELSVSFAGGKKESIKLKRFRKGMKTNMYKALRAGGFTLERALKHTLKDSNPTTFFHKSTKSHLASRTGTLRRSITSKMGKSSGGDNVTIGPGGFAAAYGKVHEEGKDITVTPKMRAFLHYKGIHLKKSTGVIRIPKREWYFPTYKKNIRKIINVIASILYRPLRGK